MNSTKLHKVQLPSGETALMSPRQEGSVTDKSGSRLGHYWVYLPDFITGGFRRRHESLVLGTIAKLSKRDARKMLRELLDRLLDPNKKAAPRLEMTLADFVDRVYLPYSEGSWAEATKKNSVFAIRRYILSQFGDRKLIDLSAIDLQIFVNNLAKQFAKGTVLLVRRHLKSTFKLARKSDYLVKDPAEEIKMPKCFEHSKPTMPKEQLAALIHAIQDPMDQCLIAIAAFCALRASEVFGLTWGSWEGDSLRVHSTAWHSNFYADNAKTKASRAPACVPDGIRKYIQRWHELSPDTSPDALMFSYMPSRGKNKGKVVPYDAYAYVASRVLPIARRLGIPDKLVSFRVLRRTAGTQLQAYGTIKDLQASLRHADAHTTLQIYVQPIEPSTRRAVNQRTEDVLGSRPRKALATAPFYEAQPNLTPGDKDALRALSHAGPDTRIYAWPDPGTITVAN
jgi:integrase